MNNLQDFKTFYLSIALPNLPSFASSFNKNNFDKNIVELIEAFKSSYAIDPFEISDIDIITDYLSQKNEKFVSYSDKKGSGIPNTLLNTHYVNFLKYRNENQFVNLQDFVNKLNSAFGNFCNTFQKQRIALNGNSRVPSNSEIFGAVRDDYWTINKGSERELQYHIFKDKNRIGYGLGFNAQKSMNNLSPIENVSKFVSAFVQNHNSILQILNGYNFINHSIADLINIKESEFILFGKTFPFTLDANQFILKEFDFLNVYYDLRYRQFSAYKDIFKSAILNPLPVSQLIKQNAMKSLLQYKKQIILQGPPGTGKTREAKLIAKEMLGLSDSKELDVNEQFKLIQFHPSYTYEDFVRGIVAESNGDKIEYKNVNKTLGDFAEKALKNYQDSQKDSSELSFENWIDDEFSLFVTFISEQLENGKIELTENVDLVDLMDDAFLYIGKNWKGYEHKMNFRDIKRAYLDKNTNRQDIVKNTKLSGSARQHATYYIVVLRKFREFLEGKRIPDSQITMEMKPFILIIDEINRANLSSVLGELIYALEYRGEAVDSMYAVEDSILPDKNHLILPPNLYIIGTMNTADRSVGHIDYAIRRRFAFVDVLPEKLTDNDEIYFNEKNFNAVEAIFTRENISSEFEIKDVQLGHSYFIAKKKEAKDEAERDAIFKMKMDYEVKPILREYLRDGIIQTDKNIGGESIKDYIEKL